MEKVKVLGYDLKVVIAVASAVLGVFGANAMNN